MQWINTIVQGILLSGQYALLACGLSLMFGVMRIVNLAHGALAIAAAYLCYWLSTAAGLPVIAALVITVPVFALFGYLLQRGLFNRALKQDEMAPLVVAFGISVILQSLLQVGFTSNSRSIPIGAFSTASVQIGAGIYVGWFSLVVLLTAIAVIGGLALFLHRTALGRAMRATSDDPDTARVMGINNAVIYGIATAIAVAAVALAGVVTGMTTQFSPGYGDQILIFAFEAVIIGGLGSLWGTLVGAMVLGLAQAIGAQLNPTWGILAGHIVFLFVLLMWPQGLLSRKKAA